MSPPPKHNWRTVKITGTIVGIVLGLLSIASYLVATVDKTSTLFLAQKFALKKDLSELRTDMYQRIDEKIAQFGEKEELRLRAMSAEISSDVSRQILTYLKDEERRRRFNADHP